MIGLRRITIVAAILWFSCAGTAQARTVYRCVRDGTVSLSTAPEPGSRCEAKTIDDDGGKLANLWGAFGVFSGTLYEREQDGTLVYGTRKLPGARKFLAFTVTTPAASPAHVGLGALGKPRLNVHANEFRNAAKLRKLDDALLRAIAHAESGFDATAVSPKGAQGIMQLMPAVQQDYGVSDPFSPTQSINAGATLLRDLLRRYNGDVGLAVAAYNAGVGTVKKYGGPPPYAETLEYVAKVRVLHARYRAALGLKPLDPPLRPAQ